MAALPARLRVFVAALGLLACGSAIAAPLSTTLKDFPGVTASMDVGEGACPATVPVTVRAENADAFRQGSRALLKVMGWAQVNAEMTCPDATSIQVTGTVNGETVYSGVAKRSDSWALTELRRPASPPVAQATEPPTTTTQQPTGAAAPPASTLAKAVQQCDALAAHPDDPEAFAAGVADDKLNAKAVIQACEAAIKADPEPPRLHFQLARGYLKADRFEDATEQLLTAAEADHGGALAYLADLHVAGAPGIEADPMLAKTLYEKAVASGFEPAKKILSEFEDQTDMFAAAEKEEQDMQSPAPPPTAAAAGQKAYKEPAVIDSILKGDIENVPLGESWTKTYLYNIADNIAAICEKHFTKPELERMKSAAARPLFKFSDRESMQIGLQLAMNAYKQINNNMDATLHRKDSGGKQQSETDYEQMAFEEAMNDTGVFLNQHGCQGPDIERFSKNLYTYASDMGEPTTDGLVNICGNFGGAIQFCRCFAGMTNSSPMTRKVRKQLMGRDFMATAKDWMRQNPEVYGFCR